MRKSGIVSSCRVCYISHTDGNWDVMAPFLNRYMGQPEVTADDNAISLKRVDISR
jgi:hypothetical protein